MRNLEDRDVQYKALLNEKLQMEDRNGITQEYNKEFENRLPVS